MLLYFEVCQAVVCTSEVASLTFTSLLLFLPLVEVQVRWRIAFTFDPSRRPSKREKKETHKPRLLWGPFPLAFVLKFLFSLPLY